MLASICAVVTTTSIAHARLPANEASKIADAIYRLEGGINTRYPYGIKSLKTLNPRQVCINTIQNNHDRWLRAGSKGNYLDFLANRYCPASVDPIGNKNWIINIHKLCQKQNMTGY